MSEINQVASVLLAAIYQANSSLPLHDRLTRDEMVLEAVRLASMLLEATVL